MNKPGYQRTSSRPRPENPVILPQWLSGSQASPPHDALSFISSSDSDRNLVKNDIPQEPFRKNSSSNVHQLSDRSFSSGGLSSNDHTSSRTMARGNNLEIHELSLLSSKFDKICHCVDQLKLQVDGCNSLAQQVNRLTSKVRDHEKVLQSFQSNIKALEAHSNENSKTLLNIKKENFQLSKTSNRSKTTVPLLNITQQHVESVDMEQQARGASTQCVLGDTTNLANLIKADSAISVDLSLCHLTNLEGLPNLLPKLLSLAVNNNQLTSLTEVNDGIILLSAANNKLSNENFKRFIRILRLNLAANRLINVPQNLLATLTFANFAHNKLVSLEGLQCCWLLHYLDCSHNNLHGPLDFSGFLLPRLQVLKLGSNRITEIYGLQNFPHVRKLCLKNNNLVSVVIDIPNLRTLNLSKNHLKRLGTKNCKKLEKVWLDHNYLSHTQFPSRLRLLSLQYQLGDTIVGTALCQTPLLDSLSLANVNKFNFSPLTYLRTLTITECQLKRLPSNFATIFPNVLNLFLMSNELENIDSLIGLSSVRMISLANNRLKWTDIAIALSLSAHCLSDLDFRGNADCFYINPPLAHGTFTQDNSRYHELKSNEGFLLREKQSKSRTRVIGDVLKQFPLLRRLNGQIVGKKQG